MLPSPSHRASFTLIELLIVIAILATLAAVIIVVINPAELLRQGRDAQRLSDLSSLNRSLSWLKADCPACSLGLPNTVYVSIPDTSPTCANLGLPSLPSGWSYACVTQANLFKADGSGWIPVDFSKFSAGSPLAKLPVDPVNTTSSGNYYTYVTGGSWALSALLESQRHLKESAAKDGGYDPGKFEVGTNLQLIAQSEGLVGWWPFDEGSGTTAKDSSGNNNNGTLTNGPTWTTGKVGGALSFDGVDDYVNAGNAASLNITDAITIEAWVKTGILGTYDVIISKGRTGTSGHYAAYQLYISDSGRDFLWRIFNPAGSDTLIRNNIILSNNSWYHVVGTYKFITNGTSQMRLYQNGELIASTNNAVGPIDITSIPLGIGNNLNGNSTMWFTGLIDEVRLYNRALSDAEIKAIYDATK